ncbi:hypothetical protein [Cellulomonas telluris]|uniref:hypothetical protein n=1 Tax=Cellulomonas telluris TaxID=2306636 RepID=UPI0014562DED|nr:hypothetical protein [Cellulomonas telluris]
MTRTVPVQRVRRLADVVAWASLVLFVVLAVGPSLLGRTVFLGVDVLDGFDPWRSTDPAPATVVNAMVGDTVDAVVPRTVLVAEGMRAGEYVRWNPYVAGGAPVLPLPDNAPFSPLSLPWYLVPATYAPGLVKVLEVAVVAVGMHLLVRRFGLPSASGAVGSLVYVSSGFMVAWTNWSQTRVAALVPLLFWAVDRAVVERRPRDVVPLALVVAAMVAGGFPAVLGWALYAAAAYALVRALALRRGTAQVVRSGAVAATGVLAGAGLLAFQLVPFVRNTLAVVDTSLRRQEGQHLDWTALATTVVADVLGGPVEARWATTDNGIENFSYIGVAALVLVLCALVRWRPSATLPGVKGTLVVSAAVTGVLVYLGGPLLHAAQQLPVFDNSFVGRMRFLLAFYVAVLAAAGYAQVVASLHPLGSAPAAATTPRSVRAQRVVAAVCVVGVAGLVAVVARVLGWVPEPSRAPLVREALVAALLAVVSGGLVLLAVRRRGPTAAVVAGVAVPLLVLVPAVDVARSWWPNVPTSAFYPSTPTHEYLAEHLEHDRYITVGQAMMPGSNTLYRLRSADGHAFHAPQWMDLLRTADPDVRWGVSGTYTSLTVGDVDSSLASPVLDRLGVRYAVLPAALPVPGAWEAGTPGGTTVTLGADGGSVRGSVAGPLLGVALTTPDGVHVGADGATVRLELRDDDGRPVARAERTLEGSSADPQLWIAVAADVPAGEEVEVVVTAEGLTAPLVLAADDTGRVVLDVRRPVGETLTVVSTGGATVVERAGSLPRIRWAAREVVVEDPQDRLEALAGGRVPDDAVLLQHAEDAAGVRASTADLDVVEDGTGTITVAVEASDAGWLVIADSMQASQGWSAQVDGRSVPLVDAEHAGAAMLVPAGRHEVALTFTTPGSGVGAVVSAAVATTLAGGALVSWVTARRRRRTAGTTQSTSNEVVA